jgi:hypothetical protein
MSRMVLEGYIFGDKHKQFLKQGPQMGYFLQETAPTIQSKQGHLYW